MSSVNQCDTCPAGTSCSVGSAAPSPCLPGSFGSAPKQETCTLCAAGKYTGSLSQTACGDCTPGYLCVEGSSAPQPCRGGTHANQTVLILTGFLSSLEQCIVCPAGTACSVGTNEPLHCLPGSYGDVAEKEKCDLCPAGKYTGTSGNTACDDCTPGYLCVEGSSAPQPCRGGTHANQTVLNLTGFLSSLDQCIICPEGTACSVGSAEPFPCLPGSYGATPETEKCDLCPAGKYTGNSGNTACSDCTPGYLCVEGSSAPVPCRGGTHANQTVLYPNGGDVITGFLSTLEQCVVCPEGTSCPVGTNEPAACLPGSYADQPETQSCILCPAGQYQDMYGQTGCKGCTRGFFCKEGSSTPVPCPGGKYSNQTGRSSIGHCLDVPVHFWAPLGSAQPEPCPPSGFSCPGALDVAKHTEAGIFPPGSKPIIQAVGGSTEAIEVPVVQMQMTLDISPDEFATQREAMIAALAEQYGVDPSLISLEAGGSRRRRLAGMSIAITISLPPSPAPSLGESTSPPTSVSSLIASVGNVSASALSAALGAALGKSVSVAVTAMAAPATKTVIRNFEWCAASLVYSSTLAVSTSVAQCTHTPFDASDPRPWSIGARSLAGKWCTAGLVVDCAENTYNNETGQDFATACKLCPLNSYTVNVSSTSIDDCVCVAGFYDSIIGHGVDCAICPVGTNCEGGATLDKLPITTGYFRLNNMTIDVRRCPDADSNCSTNFGQPECLSSSGCVGGTDMDRVCAPTLSGTFCQTCDRSSGELVYFLKSTDDVTAHCAPCGGKWNDFSQARGPRHRLGVCSVRPCSCRTTHTCVQVH